MALTGHTGTKGLSQAAGEAVRLATSSSAPQTAGFLIALGTDKMHRLSLLLGEDGLHVVALVPCPLWSAWQGLAWVHVFVLPSGPRPRPPEQGEQPGWAVDSK